LEQLKAELEEKHGVKVMVIAKDLGFPDTPGEIYETVKNAGIQVDYLIKISFVPVMLPKTAITACLQASSMSFPV